MIYVVDTHTLIWHLTNSVHLGERARQVLLDPGIVLVLPTIALAEARFLSQRGRIALAWKEIEGLLDQDSRCVVHPLDRDVVNRLPVGLNIHDAIICATALLYRDSLGEEVQIITRDKRIADSRLVETVW